MLFSEPKIPQSQTVRFHRSRAQHFSALQRAENSSIQHAHYQHHTAQLFQCSSASRKFLNRRSLVWLRFRFGNFSALQRAENSSIHRCALGLVVCGLISVLFSEPKIPQSARRAEGVATPIIFQCSSASRKFLNPQPFSNAPNRRPQFQCSSASRKFLNHEPSF